MSSNKTAQMLFQSDYVSMDQQQQQGENMEPSIEVSIGGQPNSRRVWPFPRRLWPFRSKTNHEEQHDTTVKLQDASKLRLEYTVQGNQRIYHDPDIVEEDYVGKPTTFSKSSSRWKRVKTEIIDVFHEVAHYTSTKSWKKKVLMVMLYTSSLLVLVDLVFFGNIVQWLCDFMLWMQTHVMEGIFAFIGLFIITTLVFIPPSILTFGCGYIMANVCDQLLPAIIAATLACFIGSVLGAMICFLRSRYLMRGLVELFAQRYTIVRAADKAIVRNAFRVMVLLRLCPLIPFHALNYIGGITGVSWEAFLFSLVGILPITILTVTIGATTGGLLKSRGSEEQQLVSILLMCSGLAFLIIAVAITYYFAKKELQRELEAAAAESSTSIEVIHIEVDRYEVLQSEEVEDEEWFWMFT